MSDIEGAICDECGNKVGPYGCCASRKEAERLADTDIEYLKADRDEFKDKCERMEAVVKAARDLIDLELSEDIPESFAAEWGLLASALAAAQSLAEPTQPAPNGEGYR